MDEDAASDNLAAIFRKARFPYLPNLFVHKTGGSVRGLREINLGRSALL
jgi:hypothetical protein